MMNALIWCAPYKVKVERVPDPKILNKRDAIIKLTSTCICGSDLHLVDGFVPFMKPGDILGHEPMGIVQEVGSGVDGNKLKVGDRVAFVGSLGGYAAERVVPADRVMVETDAPYLAPEPYRGKRNEPAFVAETTRHFATLRNLAPDEAGELALTNFYTFFTLTPAAR